MNDSFENVSTDVSLLVTENKKYEGSAAKNESNINWEELEDCLPVRKPKNTYENTSQKQISDNEFHNEEVHLKNTIKFGRDVWIPALKKEFKEDPSMQMYARLLRGTESQIEIGETQQDEYVDSKYRDILKNVYVGSIKLKNIENRFYLGSRELHYKLHPDLDIYSIYSEYGTIYTLSRQTSSQLNK
jgi:hypothetical protein